MSSVGRVFSNRDVGKQEDLAKRQLEEQKQALEALKRQRTQDAAVKEADKTLKTKRREQLKTLNKGRGSTILSESTGDTPGERTSLIGL